MLKSKFIFLLLFSFSCNKQKDNSLESNIDNSKNNQKTDLISIYWKEFQLKNPEYKNMNEPQSFYFCDNKKEADECAELVMKKIKQATSPSAWWFEKNKEEIPKIGDIAIVTNWNKEPKAIIRTKKVEIVKFKNITPEYAFIEGEGNKTLEYWKKVHWAYYTNEMHKFSEKPNEEMKIVCEYFETIW
ncbi:ASCH domain-containing protein [Flavobacterium amniphilum]|uniref:ASCH domain-containing protein n=1 Tax=Flavobacterium amniphilum TaxID=1834035 RepID=UPI002029CC48|nr:ASCH domain-containing protein [Flavobacterium amniphilum]MCL9805470.1 ASCH domain-containing protein [Flavobacterium amniphilum]